MEDVTATIDALVGELKQQGEDAEELDYWSSIVPYLDADKKDALATLLGLEYLELRKAGDNPPVPEEVAMYEQMTRKLDAVTQKQSADELQSREGHKEGLIQKIKDSLKA